MAAKPKTQKHMRKKVDLLRIGFELCASLCMRSTHGRPKVADSEIDSEEPPLKFKSASLLCFCLKNKQTPRRNAWNVWKQTMDKHLMYGRCKRVSECIVHAPNLELILINYFFQTFVFGRELTYCRCYVRTVAITLRIRTNFTLDGNFSFCNIKLLS